MTSEQRTESHEKVFDADEKAKGKPMFTRRHFKAVAGILAVTREIPAVDQREQIGYALANLFQADNEQFNMQRFINAAKLEE